MSFQDLRAFLASSLIFAAAAILLARALYWLELPVMKSGARSGKRFLARRLERLLPWACRHELGLVVAATLFHVLLAYVLLFWFQSQSPDAKPLGPWAEQWSHWDGEWFLAIATDGYRVDGPHKEAIAFLPLFAWAMRLVAAISGLSLIWSGLLVNFVLAPIQSLGIYKLVRLDEDREIAALAVAAALLFPTGVAQFALYSERLYLTLVVWTLLYARRRQWGRCAVVAFLASLTRTPAYCLIFPLIVEYVLQAKNRRSRIDRRALALLAIPLGIGVYLAINQVVYGSPLAFLDHQRVRWGKSYRFFVFGIFGLSNPGPSKEWYELLNRDYSEVFFTVVAIFATFVSALRQRFSYALFILANVTYFLSTNFVYSVPRYVSVLFPLHLLIAQNLRGRPVLWVSVGFVSWVLLLVYAIMFSRYYIWTF